MSRTSHLVGGLLCLAGGYLLGYRSGAESYLGGVLGALNAGVKDIPYLSGLLDQVSTTDWYISVGAILVLIGVVMVVTGGAGKPSEAKKAQTKTAQPPPVRQPGTCRFCGADLKGSTTYCPSCGRSQT